MQIAVMVCGDELGGLFAVLRRRKFWKKNRPKKIVERQS